MIPSNCTKRKHEYRIHEPLSNGQWLNLYFTKYCNSTGISVWDTGLCISETPKEANLWVNRECHARRKCEHHSTGRCGLEGLRKALTYICEFANNLKHNEELQVGWADDKRKYAYRRLFKYGFCVDEETRVYHTRNLNYWEPNSKSVSKLSMKAYRKILKEETNG